MSWDIVIFNSKQNIQSVEEIDEEQLMEIDFCSILDPYLEAVKDGDTRTVQASDYSIVYYGSDEMVSNMMVNLYGEKAIYPFIYLARKHKWQIFDTGSGEMLDLDHPERNGFQNFNDYLKFVSGSKSP